MAVDVCSEIPSPVVSPRISFSHDLKELDFVPVESDKPILNPTIDFDLCINTNTNFSSADELFANGRILPLDINITPPTKTQNPIPDRNSYPGKENTKKKRLIEFLSTSFDEEDEEEEDRENYKPFMKPFWQFRRSSSVNCDTDNPRANGLFRSLHFLTRSNSTGSVPINPKPKVMRKQHSLKEATMNRASSSGRSYGYYYYDNGNSNLSRKSSLRKSTSRSSSAYGNGVRISPVLNIDPRYIARGTVSLFGIGSFFCSKKSKKKR